MQRNLTLAQMVGPFFTRKPRSFSEVRNFKALEYRILAMYTGKVVLRGIVKIPIFDK